MISKELIVFSPHRDDAVLTFGGKLIMSVRDDREVTVHLVYGGDGYVLPDFLQKLKSGDLQTHLYLRKLSKQASLESVYDQIKRLLGENFGEEDDRQTELGILIRTIEEKACMNHLGISLVEYQYPCGYPLRGYKEFNDDNPADIRDQTQLILEKVVQPILTSNPNAELCFPSGIGGHPDHRILSLCGLASSTSRTDICFGPDLPYAGVWEWFTRSDLPLARMAVDYRDISPVLEEKLELLRHFYRSQLTAEDIRVVESYHRALVTVINRKDVSNPSLKRLDLRSVTALECTYTSHGQ